ncbi:MAG: hypothetical protein ABW148_14325 [Sedimenticola sp.]
MEYILAFATLIGGIASIEYFYNKYRNTRTQEDKVSGGDCDFFCAVSGSPYKFESASEEDLRWIAEIEKKAFRGIDVMPLSALQSWYSANKYSFIVVRGCNGKNYGYLIAIPLTEVAIQQLCNGELTDTAIDAKDIMESSNYDIGGLHVSALVLLKYNSAGQETFGNHIALKELLSSADLSRKLLKYKKSIKIFSVAGSGSGKDVIEHLGFNLVTPGAERRDNHPIYSQTIGQLKENLNKMGLV